MLVDGKPVPGSLFDFGLFFFHNAKEQIARGTGPYFYLPKMESHLEARLWNDVFLRAQEKLGVPRGTIKATCLIETLPAAFEMDEFLFELREHSAGLNCGRWDYIFSFIKKRADDPAAVLPDRSQVTMDKGFLAAYVALPHRDLPPAQRPRDGRDGRADPHQGRPGGQRGRAREGARRQAARGEGRPRRHLGGAPGPGARREGHLRRAHAGAQPARREARRRRTSARDDLLRVPEGHAHRRRSAAQRARRHPVPRVVAARQRLRAALQPHGGRGDGRDLARPGVAVAAPQGDRRRRAAHARRFARVVDEEMQRIRREVGDARFQGGRFPEARDLFVRLSTAPAVRRVPDPARIRPCWKRNRRADSHVHRCHQARDPRRRAPAGEALRGDRPPVREGRRRAAARLRPDRAHARAARREAPLGAAPHGALRRRRSARSPATRPCRWCAPA